MINSFPFNKATTIKIISYNVQFRGMVPLPPPPNIASDSNALKKWEEAQKKPIDIKNIHKQKNLIGIDESKTLNLPEIHQLYNTIFNTCGKFMGGSVMGNKCFFPRNAVLFYDEDDKVFDIFEICFECDGLRSSTESSIFINDQCNKFYPELEKFFQSKGLQTQYTQK
ncbi:hypothetical protein [Chryseobacterium arachidis]|nr:hypothetical protein [Chryseobacterium arachidis]